MMQSCVNDAITENKFFKIFKISLMDIFLILMFSLPMGYDLLSPIVLDIQI